MGIDHLDWTIDSESIVNHISDFEAMTDISTKYTVTALKKQD